jgi:4-hydroxy-2-oxoheptanedioate aldolase
MIPDPAIVETIGHTGLFDYVEFLAEYNAFTLHDLDNLARAAELSGMGCLIKVDLEQNRYVAQRAVGSGFSGAVFADVRTREDIDHAVLSLRPDTPAHGGAYGSIARRNARLSAGGGEEYVAAIADQVVGIMVEKPEIVDVLEEALSAGGIDFVQWGPSDFAMSSGLGPAAVRDVEKHVFEVCAAAGVPFRAELDDLASMPAHLDRGVRHFSIGIDLMIIRDQLARLGTGVRAAWEAVS